MALKDRTPSPVVDERKIDAVINKGGTPAAKRRASTSNFPLRYTRDDTPERIEAARHKRAVAPSVNAWVNEAILEKLAREE